MGVSCALPPLPRCNCTVCSGMQDPSWVSTPVLLGSCNSFFLPSLEVNMCPAGSVLCWGGCQSPGIPWCCSFKAQFSSCVCAAAWTSLFGELEGGGADGDGHLLPALPCPHQGFWGAQSSSRAMSSSLWMMLGSPMPPDWPGNAVGWADGPGACGTWRGKALLLALHPPAC